MSIFCCTFLYFHPRTTSESSSIDNKSRYNTFLLKYQRMEITSNAVAESINKNKNHPEVPCLCIPFAVLPVSLRKFNVYGNLIPSQEFLCCPDQTNNLKQFYGWLLRNIWMDQFNVIKFNVIKMLFYSSPQLSLYLPYIRGVTSDLINDIASTVKLRFVLVYFNKIIDSIKTSKINDKLISISVNDAVISKTFRIRNNKIYTSFTYTIIVRLTEKK